MKRNRGSKKAESEGKIDKARTTNQVARFTVSVGAGIDLRIIVR